ncbi:proline--tRNA ligase, partial [Streptomyces sp. JJ66]|uniref:His/Gly/Thr/Pro-type tRNA ligase C-terminal domain-containing protein n=1 Tax=Streptomyces sp. JJ66 TaxID=2803843 RepID=UPI001C5C822A
GVERALASVVETHHDEKGIVWPVAVAPFEAAVVVLGTKDEKVAEAAETLYRQLQGERLDVLLDDRDERPGVKFRDVELIGIPYRITVGARGLADGTVEVTTRATGETQSVPMTEAVEHVRKLVTAAA